MRDVLLDVRQELVLVNAGKASQMHLSLPGVQEVVPDLDKAWGTSGRGGRGVTLRDK